jgi:uncharacterized SAM-binding protein YcdF (DUF218 family)
MRTVGPGLSLLLLAQTGCAAWHDLFQRDKPSSQVYAEAQALPRPKATDVAVVLGCPANPDGTPSPCLRCRITATLAAYHRGEVRAAIFAGGAAHNRFIEAAVMAREAARLGMPQDAIFLEGESLTTWQNLRFSKRIMASHGFQTALLISTRDHLPRARRFAEYYGIPVALSACEEARQY